ncbi:MAG: hydrolase TatD, partial [Planctomycetes bacterium]|nr:hydrolase TatD [Planctomycetota bacterium]
NPKEAEDPGLVDEVLAGIPEYLDHDRCVAVGEIGYNNITANEERAFEAQLDLARSHELPVIVHTPHVNKPAGTKRIIEVLRAHGMDCPKVIIDHNTEETIELSLHTQCYAGMTVYPISKLTPQRVSAMIRQYGSERIIVNGSADWGISDPLSLVKVVAFMRQDGHSPEVIQRLVYDNAMAFYSQTPRWKPQLDIQPMDPRQFQR